MVEVLLRRRKAVSPQALIFLTFGAQNGIDIRAICRSTQQSNLNNSGAK